MKRDHRLECAHRCGLALLLVMAIHIGQTEVPAFAQGATKVDSVEIPMELLFSRPVIRGTVNGEGPLAVLIDPQIQTTLIASALADRVKLKAPRNSSGIVQSFVELGFGAHKIPKVPVEVGDTAHVVPELGPAAHPAAVLSLSVWEGQLVTIDYARWRVRVEPGALPEPNGLDVFALIPGSREFRVSLAVGGRVIGCRIDPLFPGSVLLPAIYMKEFPLTSKPTDVAPVRTREGAVKVREARLADSVTLAGVEITSPLVLFGDVGDVATVGYGWLARLSVTYDTARGRARLNRKP